MHFINGECVIFRDCYGYNHVKGTNKLIVNKYEAEVVKTIFKKYLEFNKVSDTTRCINELGYRTRAGKKFNAASVSNILKNVAYTGNILHGKYFSTCHNRNSRRNYGERDMYLIKNTHEAIISKEEYDKVNEIMYRKKNRFVDSMTYKKSVTPDKSLTGMVRCRILSVTL